MMRVTIAIPDIGTTYVEAAGRYVPDVMHDLKNRAVEASLAFLRGAREIADEYGSGVTFEAAEQDEEAPE